MTNSWNAAFDAMATKAFAGAGLADAAFYTPSSGGPEIPCSIYVDRGLTLQNAGTGEVMADQITVTCFAADVGRQPTHGARFRIGASIASPMDETFTVDRLNTKDESRFVCVVKPGV